MSKSQWCALVKGWDRERLMIKAICRFFSVLHTNQYLYKATFLKRFQSLPLLIAKKKKIQTSSLYNQYMYALCCCIVYLNKPMVTTLLSRQSNILFKRNPSILSKCVLIVLCVSLNKGKGLQMIHASQMSFFKVFFCAFLYFNRPSV